MITYAATIESPSGKEIVQQVAVTFEDAAENIGGQSRTVSTGSPHYAIQVHPSLQSPEVFTGLLSATGSLIACLVLLVAAEYKLRTWLKG